MSTEHPHTLEDKVAERLAQIGTMAAIISLFVLLAVLFGNVLVLAVKVAVSAVLAALVNLGPAVAALLGGISTAIGYYGRTRLLRRKEKFSLRDEARDQALDQAGNALQKAPAALSSRLGCSSSVSLGVFAVSLILCFLTYLPPPLHVFGANIAVTTTPVLVASAPTTAAAATVTTADTATALPAATIVAPTATPGHAPIVTSTLIPTHVPTATSVPPPPGHLLILPPTTIDLSYSCGDRFGYPTSSIFFSFTNNGGTMIYWTVVMPNRITLVPNYPVTGTLLANEGDSQNEYIQGVKENVTITVKWGSTAASEPNTASILVSCSRIG